MHDFLFLRFCENFHFSLAISLNKKNKNKKQTKTESTLGEGLTGTNTAVLSFPLIPWLKVSPDTGGWMVFALSQQNFAYQQF